MNKKNSIIENFLFNFLKTLMSLLFPVVTFAYSSRVLGVDGIGRVNFVRSFITYFSMIALLGMNYYGTREAAKRRDNKRALSKFVQEMLIINGFSTLVAYFILILCMLFVPKLKSYETLLLINSVSIILQGLGMEWLYQALEEYRYITIRSMIFQIIGLITMFLLVKQTSDLPVYACIYVFATFGSYTLNFLNVRRYVEWRRFKRYKIKEHLKSLIWLFAMAVSIQLYVVLDTTMLGFLQGDTAVGKYTAAIKINKMVNNLITSLGVVLIPRLSYYIGLRQMDKVRKLIDKSYNFVFLLSVPASIGLFMLSDEILYLFSGKEFLSASFTMRLLTPIVIVIPFNIITNTQTFVPMGKEKLILISTLSGAVTNMFCNLLLIPQYAENGAAVATVLAETIVAIICYRNARKYFPMRRIFKNYYQYWIAAISIVFIALIARRIIINDILRIGFVISLSIFCYLLILLLFKNPYLFEMIDIVKRKRTINDGIKHSRKVDE